MEKERKREDAKLKRKRKRYSTSLSVGDLENSKSEISKVPRSLAMLEDKLSHNFLAEGRRVRRPPEVFSPELDARKKQKVVHDEEEEEDDEDEDQDDEDEDQDDEEEDQDDGDEDESSSDIVVEELKPGELANRQSSIPKRLSVLEDQLTGYFSPKGGKRRRRSPERLSLTPAAVSTGSRRLSAESRNSSRGRRTGLGEVVTPVPARKKPAPRSLKEEVDLPSEEVETSTPVEGRSFRSRPKVSYVEVPDTNAFDLSTGDEESPFDKRLSKKQPLEVSKTRFEVDLRERLDECASGAGSRSPRRFILGSSLRKRRDLESSSASSGASSRVKVTTGKQDLSQEIVDLSQADNPQQGYGEAEEDLDLQAEENLEDLESPPQGPSHPGLPPKSPGKYQSSLTPGRGIKLMINRCNDDLIFTFCDM